MKRILLLFTTLFISSSYAHNFDNTLLIINYNHPHYQSIPLLKKIYSPYFKNIVFYGPLPHPDIHHCPHNFGYLSYLTIADAMQRYPTFDSYFFLMDDCIFNAWLGSELDTSKVWYPKIGFLANSDCGVGADLTQGLNAVNWEWWPRHWGYQAMKKAFEELSEQYKQTLAENWGVNRVAVAFSDFVNVPACYKEQFIELAQIFGKHQAFLETGLPTIMSCLCPKNEWLWIPLNSTYLGGIYDFKMDMLFNHPIKLSMSFNQQFIDRTFETVQTQENA